MTWLNVHLVDHIKYNNEYFSDGILFRITFLGYYYPCLDPNVDWINARGVSVKCDR